MGSGHAHSLYVHEHSIVHRLAPETKIVAAFVFVLAVAVTPREAAWAFALDAVVLGVVVAVARLRPRFVLTRLVGVVPFILFAVLLPVVAGGDQVSVLGMSVSREGLWGAWNVAAKATLGAATSIVLAGTTEVPEILRGLGRLRVPAVVMAIASFMIRYLEVIADELGRMRTAMTARGYDPRWLWQVRPIASSAGALFIRSYERGERVSDAMLARGYTGVMPTLEHRPATRPEWLVASVLPLVSTLACGIALWQS